MRRMTHVLSRCHPILREARNEYSYADHIPLTNPDRFTVGPGNTPSPGITNTLSLPLGGAATYHYAHVASRRRLENQLGQVKLLIRLCVCVCVCV